MKTADKKELHGKSLVELQKLLLDAKHALDGLRLDHQQSKLTNTSLISVKRKEIAVIKTLMKEKEAVKE